MLLFKNLILIWYGKKIGSDSDYRGSGYFSVQNGSRL